MCRQYEKRLQTLERQLMAVVDRLPVKDVAKNPFAGAWCRKCLFSESLGEEEGEAVGICHRFPGVRPWREEKAEIARQPLVSLDGDWCGEFKQGRRG